MMGCNDACRKHSAKFIPGCSRYLAGQKFCRTCDSWVWWDGNNCPCCSHILRTRPKISPARRTANTARTVQCQYCSRWIKTMSGARKYCDLRCRKRALMSGPRHERALELARQRRAIQRAATREERHAAYKNRWVIWRRKSAQARAIANTPKSAEAP